MSDSDNYEYDEDGNVSLDDVRDDEYSEKGEDHSDWSDNLDDMDSGEWGDQYGADNDDIEKEEVDPWALN